MRGHRRLFLLLAGILSILVSAVASTAAAQPGETGKIVGWGLQATPMPSNGRAAARKRALKPHHRHQQGWRRRALKYRNGRTVKIRDIRLVPEKLKNRQVLLVLDFTSRVLG